MEDRITVGDKIIAKSTVLSGRNQYREAGEVYTATAMRMCPDCGTIMVNLDNNTVIHSKVFCKCGDLLPSHGLGWTRLSEFKSQRISLIKTKTT